MKILLTLWLLLCTLKGLHFKPLETQIIIYGNLRSGTHGFGVFVAQTVPVDAYKNNPVNDAEISLFTKSPVEGEPYGVLLGTTILTEKGEKVVGNNGQYLTNTTPTKIGDPNPRRGSKIVIEKKW